MIGTIVNATEQTTSDRSGMDTAVWLRAGTDTAREKEAIITTLTAEPAGNTAMNSSTRRRQQVS
jgi:hypothetical protein